jgi:wyosine [tRNA(Phe)-imidazoG37] synthetase (radical SAM superfamily)
MTLGPENHDRAAAGLEYVYPVVSRRAGGVSLGINLNPNNACNWRCVYCQVPGLVRGKAPAIDLAKLARELEVMLAQITGGDWLARHAPESARRLVDFAFSGNGEPTSAREFTAAVEVVAGMRQRFGLTQSTALVLITNGSLVHQPAVQAGVAALARNGGKVWFKLDSATDAGMQAINDVAPGMERVRANLRACCALAPTWLQTCVFARDGRPPSEAECRAWLDFVRAEAGKHGPRGVLLYGLARLSHQPEAATLTRLPEAWLQAFAERVRETGLETRVFP